VKSWGSRYATQRLSSLPLFWKKREMTGRDARERRSFARCKEGKRRTLIGEMIAQSCYGGEERAEARPVRGDTSFSSSLLRRGAKRGGAARKGQKQKKKKKRRENERRENPAQEEKARGEKEKDEH